MRDDTAPTEPPSATDDPSPGDRVRELCMKKYMGYGDGHLMHPIRARHTGEQPWGWRDAVVESVDGHYATVRYLSAEHTVPRLWHHHDLTGWVRPGDPVRLHERCRVLGADRGWLTVKVDDGLGSVPDPAGPVADQG